jgi:hypothetical protein
MRWAQLRVWVPKAELAQRFFWITDSLPSRVMASNIWHTSGMW